MRYLLSGVFHNLVFVSIRKTYPMQAYKIMHGLWGMGQMMFTKYLVVVDDECLRTATRRACTTPAKCSSASGPTPTRNAVNTRGR
jgi:3-polyprenyl-4-hydroxybenzoate decarboxylase